MEENMNNIVISKRAYDLVMNGKKIKGKKYTYLFIKLLLNDYYMQFIKTLNNDELVITVKDKFNTRIIAIDDINNIINIMNHLMNENYLTNIEKIKVININLKKTYKRFLINTNNYFEYTYENNLKIYSSKKLIKLFLQKSNKFKSIIYNEYNKKESMVLLKSFALYLNNKKYIYNEDIKNNVMYILSITVDYEVIGKINIRKKPKYLEKAHINPHFILDIIKCIPSNFTDLEKAIYVYIQLCKTLTHDVNDIYRNSYTINHKNIKRLEKINIENNIIVCYEFVSIFAKILELFHIEYEIGGDKVYGRGHTYLNMLYKDAIICFDATRGIIDCDLTRAKNSIQVCNALPVKANPYILDELSESIKKVYNYFETFHKEYYYSECEYIKKNTLNKDLEYQEKINMFFSKITKASLPPVDNVKYINLLKKIIFEKNDVEISLVEDKFEKNKSKLIIIFTFNKNNEFIYYLYEYPDKLKQISKIEIENNFNNNKYQYVKFLKSYIPGINIEISKSNSKIKQLFKK